MDSDRVLLIDLEPSACRESHCEQLIALVRRIPLPIEMSVQTRPHVPHDGPFSSPALILVRSSKTKSLTEVIQGLRLRQNYTPILGLFCSGKDTPSAIYQALSNGLNDFISCPFRDIDVLPRILRLLKERKTHPTELQHQQVENQLDREDLVGESDLFLQVIQQSLRVAHGNATVLISGETGSGKELLARAIHYQSPRKDKPFVPINCGALPDHLFENEFFGHVKGAYTDASSAEQGLVAEAEEGTLFLDEVDALSLSAQVKLLRLLQEHEYRQLGSSKTHRANVRVIAATNADLLQQVQSQRFRADLYYRLNIIALHIPALRERPEDIPLLASHFLGHYGAEDHRESLQFSTDALQKLMSYTWPGNVRELQTVVQRTIMLSSTSLLQSSDIDLPHVHSASPSVTHSFHEAKAQVVEQFERTYLRNLLLAHQGNISHAAKQAGKERRAFQRLLQKYDLKRTAFQA